MSLAREEPAVRPSPSRALATTAIVTLAAMLGACAEAQPGSTSAPDRPRSTPTASATPTWAPTPTISAGATGAPGTATPPDGDAVELVPFETQNGTMRLQLPEGWTVLDNSRLTMDFEGDPWWENTVGFTSPSGTEITYYDGFGDSAGFLSSDFGIVEERAMDIEGVSAMSWWVRAADRWFVHAAVARRSQEGLEPIPLFGLPDVERTHTCTMLLLGDDQAAVGSQAEAEQLLGSAPVLEALDVMATLELTGVDPSTMPAGVEP